MADVTWLLISPMITECPCLAKWIFAFSFLTQNLLQPCSLELVRATLTEFVSYSPSRHEAVSGRYAAFGPE